MQINSWRSTYLIAVLFLALNVFQISESRPDFRRIFKNPRTNNENELESTNQLNQRKMPPLMSKMKSKVDLNSQNSKKNSHHSTKNLVNNYLRRFGRFQDENLEQEEPKLFNLKSARDFQQEIQQENNQYDSYELELKDDDFENKNFYDDMDNQLTQMDLIKHKNNDKESNNQVGFAKKHAKKNHVDFDNKKEIQMSKSDSEKKAEEKANSKNKAKKTHKKLKKTKKEKKIEKEKEKEKNNDYILYDEKQENLNKPEEQKEQKENLKQQEETKENLKQNENIENKKNVNIAEEFRQLAHASKTEPRTTRNGKYRLLFGKLYGKKNFQNYLLSKKSENQANLNPNQFDNENSYEEDMYMKSKAEMVTPMKQNLNAVDNYKMNTNPSSQNRKIERNGKYRMLFGQLFGEKKFQEYLKNKLNQKQNENSFENHEGLHQLQAFKKKSEDSNLNQVQQEKKEVEKKIENSNVVQQEDKPLLVNQEKVSLKKNKKKKDKVKSLNSKKHKKGKKEKKNKESEESKTLKITKPIENVAQEAKANQNVLKYDPITNYQMQHFNLINNLKHLQESNSNKLKF